MKRENVFFEFLSKLFATFSENPLFNILYRWLLISFTPTILVYYFCLFISSQKNLAKGICLIAFIAITSFFIYSVVHLPKNKNKHCLYIMLYSNSKDSTLITNGLVPKCQNLCKDKSYCILSPNKACRYFYNWVRLKYDTSNSKFFEFFNKYIEACNSVFVFGVLNDEQSHNIEVSKIIPNIYTKARINSIDNVTSLIEDNSFAISNNNNYNELDSFSRMMVSYADYIFSVSENKPQVKSLNTILDIYENAYSISPAFREKRFITIIENMAAEIASKPIEESQIDEYLCFCKRFLKSFPNNIKILLDLQYFSISRIINKTILPSEIKQISEELLKISDISLSLNNYNDILFAFNKAYLSLLNEDYDDAISIYRSIPTVPSDIYNFFNKTMNSPSLGIYSKYAFVINYYYNYSSPQHKKAIMLAKSLMEEYKTYPELCKSLKKFTKQKTCIPKKIKFTS